MALALMAAVAAADPSPPKALGIVAGLVVIFAGVVMVRTADRLTRAFNALYRELPGRFQYPAWFVPAIGWFGIVFGLIFTLLMAFVAK